MTTAHFIQHFDRNRSIIQSFASKLAKDFDMARFLYLETAHQAMKHQKHLHQDTFEEWLITTMKKTYNQLTNKQS